MQTYREASGMIGEFAVKQRICSKQFRHLNCDMQGTIVVQFHMLGAHAQLNRTIRTYRIGDHDDIQQNFAGLNAGVDVNRPLFAGGSKVSMDGAYGKK